MLLSNRVMLMLEVPPFVDAIMDQTKSTMRKASFCLLLVEVEFSAWLQIALSDLLLVVEKGCFSEQKERRMQKVLFSCQLVVVVEFEMEMKELSGDHLVDLSHRFHMMTH